VEESGRRKQIHVQKYPSPGIFFKYRKAGHERGANDHWNLTNCCILGKEVPNKDLHAKYLQHFSSSAVPSIQKHKDPLQREILALDIPFTTCDLVPKYCLIRGVDQAIAQNVPIFPAIGGR